MNLITKAPRILDFDIENRPLSYLGMDFTTEEVTAIAWGFADERKVQCAALGESTGPDMLDAFVQAYNAADIVTGHYIRKHDLPIINGQLIEYGMPPLSDKMTIDTKNDLLKRKVISASQENLAEMFGLKEPKIHMNTPRWREANRLTPAGIALTKQRATGDVVQHKQLRLEMTKRGLLKPPRIWRP